MPINSPDKEIIQWSLKNDRVIITQDLDFSALIAVSGASKPSLINIRLSSGEPTEIANRLLAVLPEIINYLQHGACITIDDLSVRVRLLPIDF